MPPNYLNKASDKPELCQPNPEKSQGTPRDREDLQTTMSDEPKGRPLAGPGPPSAAGLRDSPLQLFKKLCTQCSNQMLSPQKAWLMATSCGCQMKKEKLVYPPMTYCITSRI